MTKWERLMDKCENLRPFIEAGLDKARAYYIKMDLTSAYVIALGSATPLELFFFC
jgi:hypothetical protein